MKTELEELLLPVLELRRPPASTIPPKICDFETPKGYATILQISDGFVTRQSVFRVFGITTDEMLPSVVEHNESFWRKEYGFFAKGILFVAEDVFGDQYGYRQKSGKKEFVKFYCEGGETEVVPGGVNHFIEALISPSNTGIVDWPLIDQAMQEGIRPKSGEHMAFEMPLILDGPYEVRNLKAESRELHLGTLSQICSQNAQRRPGTKIDEIDG